MVLYSDNAEAVEWVNMCWRKVRGFLQADKSALACAAWFGCTLGLEDCSYNGDRPGVAGALSGALQPAGCNSVAANIVRCDVPAVPLVK